MAVDAQIALALRRDLSRLVREHEALLAALEEVNAAATLDEGRKRAFEAGLRFPGLANLGELASRAGDEREELLLAASDDAETRAKVRALVDAVTRPKALRALHRVFAASFRSPMLEAEMRYRESLKELAKQPAWPGSTVTLGDVYVPPAVTLFDDDPHSGRFPVGDFESPLQALLAWMPNNPRGSLSLVGDHGSGKSVVCQMLAVAFADDPNVLPVVLRAGDGALTTRKLARKITGEWTPPNWFDPLSLPPLLILDDRPRADSNPVFWSTAALIRCETSSIASALFFAPCLALHPFDEPRVRRWGDRWNAHSSTRFDVERLLAETRDDHALTYRPTTSPFTLLMLAQMHAAGREITGGTSLRDRAALYREMVTWACEQAVAWSNRSPAELRRSLRQLADLSHENPSGWNRSDRFGLVPRNELGAWRRPDESALAFPLVARADEAEFFHESFAEYLLAERIAFECHRLCAPSIDIGTETPLARDDDDIGRQWLRIFGIVRLDQALESLLLVMIPSWESFAQGGRRTPANFRATWNVVVAAAWRSLSRDSAWRLVVDAATDVDSSPSELRARAIDALLRLGGIVNATTREPFSPEAIEPGTTAPMLVWLHTQFGALPETSYEGAITLADADLQHANLVGADLGGLDLSNANLANANLRGADLRRCNLTNASLFGASLAGALLDGATFTNTVLIDANMYGCAISEEQHRAAVWTREEASARGVAVRDPDEL